MNSFRSISEFIPHLEENDPSLREGRDEPSTLGNHPSPLLGKEGDQSVPPPFQGGDRGGCRSSLSLSEAILASSSSVRDSLPKEYHKHFETLRQEIIDFAASHDIPRESLAKPQSLQEAAQKLSIPDLERLALLLERFEYLLVHHEPKKEDYTKALEHAERLYYLKEQYTSQVSLLKEAGILSKEGAILGIDGKKYPIPTLEQIAARLFERREELKTKHDQGFTKLLLVPFGMSLDALIEVLKQFLLKHKKDHPDFELDTNEPLYTLEDYQGADIGDSPRLVYYPQSFTKEDHGGKTKMEVLEGQARGRWTLTSVSGNPATGGTASAGVAEEERRTSPGWTIHLLQPSNLESQDTETPMGFALISRQGQGTPQGDLTPRPPFRERGDRSPLEAGKTPNEYLSLLQEAQENPDSPYPQESSMTPEDWITAFMTHLTETKKPLDDVWNTNTESTSYLIGAFFPSSVVVPFACWVRDAHRARLGGYGPRYRAEYIGARFSVMI